MKLFVSLIELTLEFLIYLSVLSKWCFRGKTAYLCLSAKPLFIPIFVNGALKTAPYDFSHFSKHPFKRHFLSNYSDMLFKINY